MAVKVDRGTNLGSDAYKVTLGHTWTLEQKHRGSGRLSARRAAACVLPTLTLVQMCAPW